jgi:hypothetical protein
MYTLFFVRLFSCPNPPEVEERGQALSIAYFLKFSLSTVLVFFEKTLFEYPEMSAVRHCPPSQSHFLPVVTSRMDHRHATFRIYSFY